MWFGRAAKPARRNKIPLFFIVSLLTQLGGARAPQASRGPASLCSGVKRHGSGHRRVSAPIRTLSPPPAIAFHAVNGARFPTLPLETSSSSPKTKVNLHWPLRITSWESPPRNAPSCIDRSASGRCQALPHFERLHFSAQDMSGRRRRRPGSPPSGKLVHLIATSRSSACRWDIMRRSCHRYNHKQYHFRLLSICRWCVNRLWSFSNWYKHCVR